MSEKLIIQSHSGPYTVSFDNSLQTHLPRLVEGATYFLIDMNVARLYRSQLASVLNNPNTVVIDATEENKSIESVIPVIELLVERKVRREHVLVAIGGGITQDITCFIASILLRGISWKFIPTTLLAQADSCIGSKSSINLGAVKNILGTFNPPKEIYICSEFLDTLELKDVLSGIGEILKAHAIDGTVSFDRLASDYDELLTNRALLLRYTLGALRIKQKYIEIDEFDRGVRNIFNYGHSFGHAIESATDFGIPHGIAISIGMDMANRIAMLRGLLPEHHYFRMHETLVKNYSGFSSKAISLKALLAALMKDKKNTPTKIALILPIGDDARIERVQVDADEMLHVHCKRFLEEMTT